MLTLAMFGHSLCVFGISQHTAVIEHFRPTNQLFALSSNYEPEWKRLEINSVSQLFSVIR